MLEHRKVVQVKIEAAKGTAESTGFTDVFVFEPLLYSTAPFDEREGAGTFFGNNVAGVVGPRSGEASFWAELRGNGVDGMDAGLAILLQGAGWLKTDEVYTAPSSPDANRKTITIHHHVDGVRKVLYAASAEFKMSLDPETRRVRCHFTFKGIYTSSSDVALPTLSPGSQPPPNFGSGTFTIDGNAKRAGAWEIDLQNDVYLRPDDNASNSCGIYCADIVNQKPKFTCDIEHELVAAYDVHATEFLAGNEVAVSIVGGSGAGDQITIAMPQMQIKEAKESGRGGIVTYDIVAQLNNTGSGDDAVTITVLAA